MSKEKRDQTRLLEDISIRSSQSSFSTLFHDYCSKLFAFSLQITGDKQMSEEVVSDVFTKIWKNRKNLKNIENLNAYLYKSVRNQSKTRLRKCVKEITFTQITPEIFITNHSPETSLINGELEKLIHRTIENMPGGQQMIFKLVKNDGLKYREVAEVLDISISTVETQMVRALRKLRESVAQHFEGTDMVLVRKSK